MIRAKNRGKEGGMIVVEAKLSITVTRKLISRV